LRRRKWLTISGIALVVVVVFGHPLYLRLFSWGANPLTVSELNMEAEYNQQLRVEGMVATGTVDFNNSTGELRFSLTDGRERVDVYYQGIIPDNFRPGNELTLYGTYGNDGVFEAVNMNSSLPVCILCH
jgi:cytochrome c-type biogenesis protein CcmE